MKKCNRVVFQSMRSRAVHHNGAQCCMRDFFFSHCSPPSKNSKKIYLVKASSRKIWLWSLSNITSKIIFQKIQKFFQVTIFLKNSFFFVE